MKSEKKQVCIKNVPSPIQASSKTPETLDLKASFSPNEPTSIPFDFLSTKNSESPFPFYFLSKRAQFIEKIKTSFNEQGTFLAQNQGPLCKEMRSYSIALKSRRPSVLSQNECQISGIKSHEKGSGERRAILIKRLRSSARQKDQFFGKNNGRKMLRAVSSGQGWEKKENERLLEPKETYQAIDPMENYQKIKKDHNKKKEKRKNIGGHYGDILGRGTREEKGSRKDISRGKNRKYSGQMVVTDLVESKRRENEAVELKKSRNSFAKILNGSRLKQKRENFQNSARILIQKI